MILDVLKFVVEKIIAAKMQSNIVDVQLLKCYYDVLSNVMIDSYSDITSDNYKQIQDTMMAGLNRFDSYGNPEKMYASMCLFSNKILSADEYRKYADQLVKKMVAYPELSAYVDIPAFKEKIMEDFDIANVQFPKTKRMIYNDYNTLVKELGKIYDLNGYIIMHDLKPGTHALAIKDFLKVNPKATKGRLYTYVIDTELKLALLPVENLVVDKDKQAIYFTTTEDRCTLIIGAGKLPKRENISDK